MSAERRLENTVDSFVMLTSNSTMSAINCFFFLSVIGLNIFGLMVTRRLGSVFRAVLLTSRTAAVSTCVDFSNFAPCCSNHAAEIASD